MTSRCFIIERTQKDVAKAAEFGEITYIFNARDGRSSMWSDAFRTELIESLEKKQFNPAFDYFVWVGSMVQLAIVLAAMLNKYGPLNLLVYDAVDKCYKGILVGDIVQC